MKNKSKSKHTKTSAKPSETSGKSNSALKVVLIVVGVILLLAVIGAATSAYIFGSILKRATNNGSVNVNGKSVEIKGKDGNSVAIGENAKLPDGFPADVPLYPGAKIVMANKTNDTYTVTLTSTDAQSKVKDYYDSELSKNGWQNKNQNTSFGDGSGQAANLVKANREMIFILSAPNSTQNVTGISIAVSTKTDSSSAN